MKIWISSIVYICFTLVLGACSLEENKVTIPEDAPEFVKKSDIESINWENKAVKFNDGMIGNKHKVGIIGANQPNTNEQKWMWHLWGEDIQNATLTVLGYQPESNEIHPILFDHGSEQMIWSQKLGPPHNGADVHMPSMVSVPKAGDWALLLYVDGEYFDTVVHEIN